MITDNIHPEFHRILSRKDKEAFLNQHSCVIWFTGLSGSGKTTLGSTLEKKLSEMGYLTQILDGDNIRSGINNNLGFSEEDRLENIRRIAEVSKLFVNCGIITINSFISPTKEIRDLARSIIGDENFIEIFLSTPVSVCEKRDVKGLYKKAREGKISNFTGISSPFEPAPEADLEIDTSRQSIDDSVKLLLDLILPRIRYQH